MSIRTQIYGDEMKNTNPTTASLAALIVLQSIMLMAMFTKTAPHPPVTIPLFAMGPFLGLAISLALCAILMGSEETGYGRTLTVLATFAALLSFGPQKWFDPLFHQIWPAVIGAQICAAIIVARLINVLRITRHQL